MLWHIRIEELIITGRETAIEASYIVGAVDEKVIDEVLKLEKIRVLAPLPQLFP